MVNLSLYLTKQLIFIHDKALLNSFQVVIKVLSFVGNPVYRL